MVPGPARFPDAAELCVARLAPHSGSALRLAEVIEIVGSDLSFATGTALWDARALGVHPGGVRCNDASDVVRVICERADVMLLEPNEAEQIELHMFMTSPEVVMQVVGRKMETASA
jgi:hypothetical protein